jgi:hypothetical protein
LFMTCDRSELANSPEIGSNPASTVPIIRPIVADRFAHLDADDRLVDLLADQPLCAVKDGRVPRGPLAIVAARVA